MATTTIECRQCDREIDIQNILYPDFACPNCEEPLPQEGLCNGEYVVVCPECHQSIPPGQVCDNDGICPNCQEHFLMYLLMNFPSELKGKMCPRFKDNEGFLPEDFDNYECVDCLWNGCRFIDPQRWEEERESILKMMFCNREDDDED